MSSSSSSLYLRKFLNLFEYTIYVYFVDDNFGIQTLALKSWSCLFLAFALLYSPNCSISFSLSCPTIFHLYVKCFVHINTPFGVCKWMHVYSYVYVYWLSIRTLACFCVWCMRFIFLYIVLYFHHILARLMCLHTHKQTHIQ